MRAMTASGSPGGRSSADSQILPMSTGSRTSTRDAVRQGHTGLLRDFLQLYLKEFAKHDGYVIGDLGDWRTDYTYRGLSDAIAIGGQRANIAVYPVALFDATKAALTFIPSSSQ